jgi:hypothetical protein
MPAGQRQVPATQEAPPVQATPQAPQLPGSDWRSTQAPAQGVCPSRQASAQAPWAQTWSGGHRAPQAPQLWGSLASATQPPPQSVLPTGQAQNPATHVSTPGHATQPSPQ